ncbi:hypothetical protein C8R46DRAFT_1047654 [Mycena filopes]|nr:hypothetical protein C8R46DRAFT_1047654 [Mycena filopes]
MYVPISFSSCLSSTPRSCGHSIRLKTTWLTHDVGVETAPAREARRLTWAMVRVQSLQLLETLQPRGFGGPFNFGLSLSNQVQVSKKCLLGVRRANTRLGVEPMFKTPASTMRRSPQLEVSKNSGGLFASGAEPMFKITASTPRRSSSTGSLRVLEPGIDGSRSRLPMQKLRSECAATQNGGLNLCSKSPRRVLTRRSNLTSGFRDASTQIELNFNLSLRGPGSTDWFKLCRRPLHSNHSVVTDLVFHSVLGVRRVTKRLGVEPTFKITVSTSDAPFESDWTHRVQAMRPRLGGEVHLTEVGAVHLRVGVSGGAAWPELGNFNLVSQVNTVQTWPGFEQLLFLRSIRSTIETKLNQGLTAPVGQRTTW